MHNSNLRHRTDQVAKQTRGHRRKVTVAGLMAMQAAVGVGLAGPAHAVPSTERVSVNSAELQANSSSALPAVSSDGSHIAFSSGATNLAGGVFTSGQVYLRDKLRGATEMVSIPSNGGFPNGRALAPSVSDNGRFIAFQSFASNLVSGDSNGKDDIFVHDKQTAITTRVSVSSSGIQGNGTSFDPMISGDGRFVAFGSGSSNLVSGDTNNQDDIFVHDRVNRTTKRVSVGTTGVQANNDSRNPSISRDGSRIAFESFASNLIAGADTNGTTDVFVASQARVLFRASQSNSGAQGDSFSVKPAISGDARAVVFESRAANLVSGDTNSRSDVFHHDLASRRTIRVVNGRNSGFFNDPGNGNSGAPSVNHNGRVVAFHSSATNLVNSDPNGSVLDVFVAHLDRPLGSQNVLASVSSAGAAANGASAAAALSSNAQVVGFHSQATNLVGGDTNRTLDVFARTLQ